MLLKIIIIIANKLQGVYYYRILITENIKRINILISTNNARLTTEVYDENRITKIETIFFFHILTTDL